MNSDLPSNKKMAPQLNVIIATAGRAESLRATLTSLVACRKPETYCQTVVIENGPKVGTEDVVNDFYDRLNTLYIYTPVKNKSHALNIALSRVHDSLLVFTDDDVRIHPETLCAYIQKSNGVTGGQFFGGSTGVDFEKPPPNWIRGFLPPSVRGLTVGEKNPLKKEELAQFLGFNWAAFSNDLVALGGFDTDLGPGSSMNSTGQERDMHIRLYNSGVKPINVPNAMVWHYISKDQISIPWVIKRAYRGGTEEGLRQLSKQPSTNGVLGGWDPVNRNMIRAYFKNKVYLDRFPLFEGIIQLSRLCGVIKGKRLALRDGSKPSVLSIK